MFIDFAETFTVFFRITNTLPVSSIELLMQCICTPLLSYQGKTAQKYFEMRSASEKLGEKKLNMFSLFAKLKPASLGSVSIFLKN